ISMAFIHLQGRDDDTADNAPEFVVVLGAQIQGDQPSLTLKKRLDLAADYLSRNPDAKAFVSGGQGSDEDYTEAYIMSQYLQRCGIEEDRIIPEEAATNTRENLFFSAAMAKGRGVPTDRVLIITSEFHMARAKYLARQLGIEPVGISSKTWPWILMVNYELREVFAFVKAFLLNG
ncbi:MAG: YdcF family protein, partial [Clostridia bacterium]|nr:YdcF family protein [Clostridia bacterium]